LEETEEEDGRASNLERIGCQGAVKRIEEVNGG